MAHERNLELTISCLCADDQLALDHHIPETLTILYERGHKKIHERKGADTASPKPLERLSILCPCLKKDLKPRLCLAQGYPDGDVL
jgi:hypothetical protein